MRRLLGSLGALSVAVALAVVALGVGGSAPSARVTGTSSPAAFVPAPGASVEVAPAFSPSPNLTDLGPAGSATSLTVEVGLASRDPGGLDAYVGATEAPGTPLFRAFLSAPAADQRYGALASSVAAAEGYFQGFGLATEVHPDGLLLSVSGTAPALARAFDTTFETFRTPSGATFVAHLTPATLPKVAPWTGVLGLSTEASFAPDVHLGGRTGAVSPAAGCATTVPLTACEVEAAYDVAGLLANGTNGSGKRIAVIDAYTPSENASVIASDLAAFSSAQGLPPASLRFAYPVPFPSDENLSGTNAGWATEDALDPQWAHAVAPGASLTFVLSPNPSAGLYFAIDWVVAERAADVITMSWGEPEVGVFNAATTPCSLACNASTDGSFAILDPVLELGAVEGIGAFAASGDCGSADGTSGVAVNFPASDDYVTGVGATNLTTGTGGSYVSESAWGGNGSGARAPGCTNQGGSGGGFSVLPRPSWQAGTGTVASAGRGVPDVAIVGGAGSPVSIEYGGVAYEAWGTSVGTPMWAGIEALADQAYGGDLGSLNPSLYRILRSSSYASDLHAITSGSNGYAAHAGWNPVTGVGSPNVGHLVAELTRSGTVLSNLTSYVYASPRSGAAPLTVGFTVNASGGSGTYALEGVDFGDGNASAATGGAVEHTYTSRGVYSAEAYVFDTAGNVSVSPAVVVDVGGTPLTVNLTANSTTPAVGGNVTFTATVTGGTAPYLYNFSFGDGSFVVNSSSAAVVHRYSVGGSFCAEVVARTTSAPPDGGASPRVDVEVGGAAPSTCGNPGTPIALAANGTPAPRDAPADFPSLFRVTGGSGGPDVHVAYNSSDPYTAACDCTIFRAAGSYRVEGWANDSVDGSANASVEVVVEPALKATFGASKLDGTVPFEVQFDATVSGGYLASAANTHWRFGDGQGAVGATASATYTAPGEYVAIASLSDAGYGNASEAFLVDAEPATGSSVGVVGTVTPAVNVSSGATVAWGGFAIGPASTLAGSVLAWSLGYGGDAFGATASETYLLSEGLPPGGQLDAAVAVEGPTLSVLARVPVDLPGFFATEAGGFVPAVDALALSATLPATRGIIPLAVAPTASSTGPGGATVRWTFGDGTTATGDSGAHVYYAAGKFTLKVAATDGFADAADLLQTVVANPALTLEGCGASSRSGSAPLTVRLEPTAAGGTGPPYRYAWTLPDGTTSNATNVTLTFGSVGTYHVSVVVYDPSNASFGCAWSVAVSSVPVDAFFAVLAGGILTGVVLAAVFVVATRPRPRERPGDPERPSP